MTTVEIGVGRRVRRAFGSVRVRLTLIATALLALALGVAAAIMLAVLHQSLLNSADAATASRAADIAATLRTESIAGLDPSALAPTADIDVVQVVDSSGRVVAATARDRTHALTSPVAVGTRRAVDGATLGDNPAEYRATVLGVRSPAGDATVVVGAAEGPINHVVITVAILLASVFPVILVLLAASTSYAVARALRPVERIRSQVAAISSADLSERVSEPATRDEIARLATTMNEMLERLQSARDAQLRFVGDASHELRSPLVTVVGLLELARNRGEDLDHATVDEILLPEAHRLRGMVDDLLLLARADERGLPVSVEDVDLDDIVTDEIRRLGQLGTVTVAAHVRAARVVADRAMLQRAIRNVVDNALRHARSTVELTVDVDPRGGASVTVGDDGPGIPVTERYRVLERFVRLDPSRRRSNGGTGLGLAITAEIVRAHHGTLTISASDLGGAAITITVPPAGDEGADQPASTSR
ncbi:sensor histidine kinase [Williamsia deligens]|uniref:histidine kinase n=1 Tax=Williamsia deligens TaxID=321325 RepID=A0ABW3G8S3_9NOCA|nr:ATP-binding protein [Williamsia deligens]MCP2192550.1 Signal transduction histidine kinase [Williamsia deligens]